MTRRWLVAVVIALALVATVPATAGADSADAAQPGVDRTVGGLAPYEHDSPAPPQGRDRNWPVPPPSNDTSATAQLESLLPSPSNPGDAGEAVSVTFATPTDGAGWRLRDDAGHVARLPNRTLSGSVTLSPEPDVASAPTDGDAVLPLAGQLRLANGGDALRLLAPDGTVVDRARYDSAREGQRYVPTDAGWRWRRPGATDFEPVAVNPGNATAFVLPDAPGVPLDVLRSADDRILLGGYTLTSDRVVDALVDAHREGIAVAVLLDGAPIGGTSQAQVDALDRLADAGVNVTVLADQQRRYASHHPKYAVVDDRALVLTENWKPAGVGGRSSRGWGVVVPDAELASALADVFRADATGGAATPWQAYRGTVDPNQVEQATGTFQSRFAPAEVAVDRATLLLTPDNAEPELTTLLRSAEESIRIQQVDIGGIDDPLLQAALDAAQNGTSVEILLGSSWYAAEENRQLADEIEALADREGLPVSASLIEPAGAFEKNHAKGVIVDDQTVVVGSLNWNPTALRENREVLVVLEGEAVAEYYATVFAADRRGVPHWPTPVGLAGAVAAAWLALVAVVMTRIRWR